MDRDDADTNAASGEPTGPSGDAWRVSRSGPRPRLLIALVVIVVLVIFAIVNFNPVHVNFVLFEARARVVTVIAIAAALGFVVGWFVGRPAREERRHLREWRSMRARGDDRS
jgi:uncharacterized integral membrane protein